MVRDNLGQAVARLSYALPRCSLLPRLTSTLETGPVRGLC